MTTKKEIFGWCMYDFANTIFSALFITVYFPLFIVLIGGTPFHVGLAMSVSMILAALAVPFLGALADITKRKKLLLIIFTLICCICTLFAGFFSLPIVLIFAILANFFYHASLDIYDAMLVNISNKRNIGFISGTGTGIGYLGTLLSVSVAYIIGFYYGYESIQGIRAIFIATAFLFLMFSLFTFAYVKEKSTIKIKKYHLKEALGRVIYTLKNIRKLKNVWVFLLSSFFYTDGANTAIIFLFLYAQDQLGLKLAEFLPIYVIMAIFSAIGSFVFGKLTDSIGHKKALNFVLFLWIVIILGLYIKTTYTTFLVAGSLGGALLGGIWTITRPILVEITPKDKIAELFGYQGLTEKFSGVIGPMAFGFVATAVGFKEALLVVIALFLFGIISLWLVEQ